MTEENNQDAPQIQLNYKTPWGTIEPIESIEWETQCFVCDISLNAKNSSGWEVFRADENGIAKSRKVCDACSSKSGPKPGDKICDEDGNIVGIFK